MKLNLTVDLQIARKNASDELESDAFQQEMSQMHTQMDDLAQAVTDSLEVLKFESEVLNAQDI